MSKIFYHCLKLKEIYIFSFKTDNVTDMKERNVLLLQVVKKINLPNFNNNKVKNMSRIFFRFSS